MLKQIGLTLLVLSLAACGPEQVPTAVVDNNMQITQQNAQKNGDAFMSLAYPAGTVDARLGTPMRVMVDSDSTVSKTCRYGDGWASGKILFDSGKSLTIKCQTNGRGKGINGCLVESDFVSKPYASEEKTCQNLAELVKF
jgi:hypothetical protein